MRPSPALAAVIATILLVTAACGEAEDDAATVTTSTTAAEPAGPAAPGGPVTTAPPVQAETERETDEQDEASAETPGEDEVTAGGGGAAPEGRVVSLVVEGGQVTSNGGDRIDVAAGETLVLEVTSDVVEEVHVHGYDIEVALAPGEPTTIAIPGDLPGVWEVELHGSGTKLIELAVDG